MGQYKTDYLSKFQEGFSIPNRRSKYEKDGLSIPKGRFGSVQNRLLKDQ